ncbi:inner membrane protein YpjD [Pontibacterium sp.]|uniref:cytochrome C assembly family protein n=1 Tax=Pontibacterium sp. TaxID=2036026 RepID=UPI003512692E
MLILPTLLAAAFYAVATFLQWQILQGERKQPRKINQLLGWAGFACHTVAVYALLHQPQGIHLGFFAMGSLVSWLVVAIVLLSSIRQAIDNLFIGVFPIALLAALIAGIIPEESIARDYDGGLITHILLSVLAYSILTLAVLQAVLVSRQHSALKHHHTRGLVASLPPLQTMDRLLFEMIWSGLILLTAALISGFLFVDDLFAQHLIHKTVLSLIAWVLYATLICGRQFFGWRSHTATRWTIGGFILLAMAFFGSKLVLEWLL